MSKRQEEAVDSLKQRLDTALTNFEKFNQEHLKPLAAKGAARANQSAKAAKQSFYQDVLPATVAALGTAKVVLDLVKDAELSNEFSSRRKAVGQFGSVNEAVDAAKSSLTPAASKKSKQPKKKHSLLGKVFVAVGVIAAINIAGAVIAKSVTLADDDWIGIDE